MILLCMPTCQLIAISFSPLAHSHLGMSPHSVSKGLTVGEQPTGRKALLVISGLITISLQVNGAKMDLENKLVQNSSNAVPTGQLNTFLVLPCVCLDSCSTYCGRAAVTWRCGAADNAEMSCIKGFLLLRQ